MDASSEVVKTIVNEIVKGILETQLRNDAITNNQDGNLKLHLKKMSKDKYEKEYEKYRRYKKYKRRYKELKNIALEWEKCQEAEKKRREEEETRRNYISGNFVNREEIKKKLTSHQNSYKKVPNEDTKEKPNKDKENRDKEFIEDRKDKPKKDKENKDKELKEKVKKDKDKIRPLEVKEKERTKDQKSKEYSKDISKEKDRRKNETKTEPKKDRELPLVNGKPYSTTFKQLIKKDKSTSHHEKRPMEKFVNKNLQRDKKSSTDKRHKAMDPVDVMKQMREASKIGERATGPSFKIPKKSGSSSILGETENSLSKKYKENGKYHRIKREVSTPDRELSSPATPSTSSDDSSSEEEQFERSSSSPNIYKDAPPLPLPHSPPASPDSISGEVDEISESEEECPFSLSEDIKPLCNGMSKEHDPEVNSEELAKALQISINDDAPTDKFFCQLCDLFDKEGGHKSTVLLHILQNHYKGFSDEIETCQTIQEKMKLFTNAEIYSKQLVDCCVDVNLYQPALILDDNITRWKCLRCANDKTMYKNEKEAQRHVALEHYGEMLVPRKWFSKNCQEFECSQFGCDKKFSNWICLTNHEILLHDAFKGYLGRVFKNDFLLKTNIPKKRLRN